MSRFKMKKERLNVRETKKEKTLKRPTLRVVIQLILTTSEGTNNGKNLLFKSRKETNYTTIDTQTVCVRNDTTPWSCAVWKKLT